MPTLIFDLPPALFKRKDYDNSPDYDKGWVDGVVQLAIIGGIMVMPFGRCYKRSRQLYCQLVHKVIRMRPDSKVLLPPWMTPYTSRWAKVVDTLREQSSQAANSKIGRQKGIHGCDGCESTTPEQNFLGHSMVRFPHKISQLEVPKTRRPLGYRLSSNGMKRFNLWW
ncbi:hypothetical protein JMJ35_004226 [Cladonia borealis]|uniref:Uncharacterized protein n=1 Tax=Cladonia borealis TaxID=184061 RepID=A0AA39V8P0_9LECA|nr:hypothetical protein JMJ35_004226 [Cladonia borealis]